VIKDGRFGAYVTDGTTNATLRKDDTIEEITLERAAQLLAEKRAAGPSKRAAKKSTATAKKTVAKRATAKKAAAKKTTAKRAAAKKTVASRES
jgi:DNA topoisomerase-1